MASISKRGNYWRAQVRIKGQQPISRTFDTKAKAEKWARHTESEMDRGVYFDRTEAENTTLLDALDRYEREVIVHKNYPEQEIQRVRHWRSQALSKRSLATLRSVDFAAYRDERIALGKATATVRQELQVVSHLFETARKEWGMECLMNPLKNIRKPTGSKERDRRLREGEYETIKASLAPVAALKAPLGVAHRFAPSRVHKTGLMQSGLRWRRSHSRCRFPVVGTPYAPPAGSLWVVVAPWHWSGASRSVSG